MVNAVVGTRCWVEVDLDALRANLAWIQHRVGPDVKVITVVKADAYGHGLKSIAALLMQSGTHLFGVATLAEAAAIRSVGAGWPVLMLGAALPEEWETAIRDDVMLTVSTLAEIQALSGLAGRLKRTASLHLKVDTGMGRLGILPELALDAAKLARSLPNVRLSGLYTHYSSVEEEASFTRQQRLTFKRVRDGVKADGGDPEWVHAANSGGVLLEVPDGCNAVRPGLLVYGVPPSGLRLGARSHADRFQPALSWKARVSLVKEVKPGTRLSYGGTFTARKRMLIATVTAGYGDGYMRSASNRGEVVIRGKRCQIAGRITMDQMLVDVTRVGDVLPGEEVTLLGSQGDAMVRVEDLAAWMGTIPWEVFTNITYRVPRHYRGGQAS